jgi:DNA-binding NarL/FixJ family response regulator
MAVAEPSQAQANERTPQAANGAGPVRLLLVDDHPVVRTGLKALLASEFDLEVTAEASHGSEAVTLVEKLSLQLVVMDVSLPGLSGADTTRQIKQIIPDLPVLALSIHEELAFVRMMLDAGASGYVLKRSAGDELVRAARRAAAGEMYLDPRIAGQLLRSQDRTSASGTSATARLSEREGEVVRLLAQGLTMKELAHQLALSPRTLETYRARAMEKLNLKTRADLVRYALRCGWLGA